jgi:hypothetical protein
MNFSGLSPCRHSLFPTSATPSFCNFLTIVLLSISENARGLPRFTTYKFEELSILLYSDVHMGHYMTAAIFSLSSTSHKLLTTAIRLLGLTEITKIYPFGLYFLLFPLPGTTIAYSYSLGFSSCNRPLGYPRRRFGWE